MTDELDLDGQGAPATLHRRWFGKGGKWVVFSHDLQGGFALAIRQTALRNIEEAMAENYAQLRVHGLKRIVQTFALPSKEVM
jgi:hypothetical protein